MMNHRITKLQGALNVIYFQPLAVGKDSLHRPGCSKSESL